MQREEDGRAVVQLLVLALILLQLDGIDEVSLDLSKANGLLSGAPP